MKTEIALGQPRVGVFDEFGALAPQRARDLEMKGKRRRTWSAIPDSGRGRCLPSDATRYDV
jgi:hypothetical protein